MISEEGLQKFIKAYEQEYSVRLTRQEAFNMFSKLINLVKIAYSRPEKTNNEATNN